MFYAENNCNASLTILEVYDLLSTVSVFDLAHMDVKEIYRSGSEICDLVIIKLDTALLGLPILSQGEET